MKSIGKIVASLLLIISLLLNIISCIPVTPDVDKDESPFYIDSDISIELNVGESITLTLIMDEDISGDVIWTTSHSHVSVENGVVTALSPGQAVVQAFLGEYSDGIIITVVGEVVDDNDGDGDVEADDEETPDQGNQDEDIKDEEPKDPPKEGEDTDSETVTIPGTEDPITEDPYVNVDVDEFYANYTPAISYMDAYYRTLHGLMSGSIDEQDQKPTTSAYRPTSGGKYIRNNVYIFSEDGNTYYVVDCYGEIAFSVYKGGAYVILEEVAAYVFAFGEPPANHNSNKKASPSQSIWGIYLRVNNTKFSGDTSKYRYEPVLPRISGCGGDLVYYEMDIGTTGTDCDPSYAIVPYNNGKKITRGAARIVYSCEDRNGNDIIDLDERYVFYTYNHYNDFQEYLNYAGGWGEMFGNITGGGQLSSNTNCNPTPYVEVVRTSVKNGIQQISVVYYYVPKSEFAA